MPLVSTCLCAAKRMIAPTCTATPRTHARTTIKTTLAAVCLLAVCATMPAQAEKLQRRPITGHLPMWAVAQADLGALDANTQLSNLTVLLSRPAAREAAFKRYMDNQQNPDSASYHKWLAPEAVGKQFGPSMQEVNAVSQWLTSQKLQVTSVSPDRMRITFGGSSGAIAHALDTEFHRYKVATGKNVEQRIAVNREPSVPAALAPFIAAFGGLSTESLVPDDNSVEYSAGTNLHLMTPTNFNKIYDVTPALNAGYNGTGVKVAVIAASRVNANDITDYQTAMGLNVGAQPYTIIPPAGTDPGVVAPSEPTLDVNRVMSVAPGAFVDLVVSGTVGPNSGVYLAAQYEVNTLLDPVMSISYGGCEATNGSSVESTWNSLFQTAAAEGITVVVASGDSGAECDGAWKSNNPAATTGTVPTSPTAGINYLCASQYVTCVGGTTFADTASPSTYWTDSGTTFSTAKSYIPEGTFDEATDSSSYAQVAGSGGGVSIYQTKPAYQTSALTGSDTNRDVPDISFVASAHDGYYLCLNGDCENGKYRVDEGTSAAAANMAGVMAIVTQKFGKQGNFNPTLYFIDSEGAYGGIYHDITPTSSGVSPCAVATPSICNNSEPNLTGFALATAYDKVTGIGSMDISSFVLNLNLNSTGNRGGNPYPYTAATTTYGTVSGFTVGPALAANIHATTKVSSTDITADGTLFYTATISGGPETAVTPSTVLSPGTYTLRAYWQPLPAFAGTYGVASAQSASFIVAPLLNHIAITVPSSATAGTAFNATVTGYSSTDNSVVVTGYTGPVKFSSSDTAAILPGSTTLTAGVGTVSVTLKTSGTQTVTVADSSGSPSTKSSNITVSAATAASINVMSGTSQSAIIGAAFTNPLIVQVLDAYSNPVSGVVVTFTPPASGASASLSSSSTCTTASVSPVGTCSVTATANGTASSTAYTVSAKATGVTTPASFSLTNNQHSTAVGVTISIFGPLYGQPLTLTATLSPSSAGGSAPTGNVTFFDGATNALTPNSAVASAAANYTVSVPAAGSHSYYATYLGDANFSASTQTALPSAIVVVKASSTLTGPASTVFIPFGQSGTFNVSLAGQFSGTGIAPPSGTVAASVGNGLNTSLQVAMSNGVATITFPSNGTVQTYPVTVSYAGDGNYAAAQTITVQVQVGQIAQTIAFSPATPVTYGVSPITLAATGGSSGNAVTFSVVSGPGTISGSTLTVTGAGTIVVAANQAGNTTYSAATQVTASIVVNQATQTISFSPATPVTYGVAPITLSAAATSSLSVTFSVVSGPGTISGSTLTVTGAGTIVVAANQAGNTTYSAATQVTASIVVNQATQTISFSPATPVTYGVSPITLTATGGSSGNAVTFSFVSGPGTISGSTLTVTGAGTIVVAANQAGNTTYSAATQVTASIVVNKPVLTVTANPATSVYGATFPAFTGTLTGVAGSDGITATYATTATPTSPAGGSYTITATLVDPNSKLGNYTVNNTPAALTIIKATPAAALAASVNPVLTQNTETLTATISSSASVPTGSVNFLDGTTLLSTVPLTNGVAVLGTSTLSIAAHSITAVYSGDTNFVSIASAAQSITVQDFNLAISVSSGSASVTSVTTLPGGTAVYTFTLSPVGSTTFPATVTLSASGLPAGATATFSPSTLAAGTGSTNVTLTIQLPATTAKLQPANHFGPGLAPFTLALLLLPFSRRMRRAGRKLRRGVSLALLLLGLGAAAGLTGCGYSSGFFGQPQQTYTVTVAGTSGALVHSTTVTLTVE